MLLIVETGGKRPEDKHDEHATGGNQEHGATADLVDKHSHGDGYDERQACGATGETELLVGVGDASGVVEDRYVVGDDGISGPLREDTEGEKDSQPVSVALGLKEVGVAAGLLVLHLQSEGLLDFPVLELHSGVLVVAVAVVLGEDSESILVLVLGDKVTRRLRDPVNESKLDN